MARKAWRKGMERDADFVVRRRMTVDGARLRIGDPFDKSGVDPRRLRQMYEMGIIAFADAVPGADAGEAKEPEAQEAAAPAVAEAGEVAVEEVVPVVEQAPAPTKADLQAHARALGINIDNRWGIARLNAEIAKVA